MYVSNKTTYTPDKNISVNEYFMVITSLWLYHISKPSQQQTLGKVTHALCLIHKFINTYMT